jgi:hypothetical protein
VWWLDNPSVTLAVTERMAALGVILGSLEMLARPRALAEQGMLSWPVSRLRSPALAGGRSGALLDPLFNAPGVYALCLVRAMSGVLVLAMPSASTLSICALVVAAVTSLLLMLRTSYGNDGADQMMLIVLLPAAGARLIGDPRAIEYALWFIALQCCLSYFTSGIGKLRGQSWRDGSGIVGILTTRTYGVSSLAWFLKRHRVLAVALSWLVILTEITFPIVFVAPDSWVPFILAGGLGFHIANAFVMGLNGFVWSFGAAYPAVARLSLFT